MTSPWRQFRLLSRLFGTRHLLGVKRRHQEGNRYVRGYIATSCMWALLECGLLDALGENGGVELETFARDRDLDLEVLEPVVEYLDGISILRRENGRYLLDDAGRRLMREPRGFFDLLRGYKPVFEALDGLLAGRTRYGADVTRDAPYVAKGSGALGRNFPFPMMRDLMQAHGKFKIVDIGCGDLELLFACCEDPRFECWGFDKDPEVIAYARGRLADHAHRDRIHITAADMFDLREHADAWRQVDAFCAIDVFHEYLWDGPDRVQQLLCDLRTQFPQQWLFVAEFCHPAHEWLRRHPTPLLDHGVCHALTKQRVQDEYQWAAMFRTAGYDIVEPRVFPFLGLGYFALRPASAAR